MLLPQDHTGACDRQRYRGPGAQDPWSTGSEVDSRGIGWQAVGIHIRAGTVGVEDLRRPGQPPDHSRASRDRHSRPGMRGCICRGCRWRGCSRSRRRSFTRSGRDHRLCIESGGIARRRRGRGGNRDRGRDRRQWRVQGDRGPGGGVVDCQTAVRQAHVKPASPGQQRFRSGHQGREGSSYPGRELKVECNGPLRLRDLGQQRSRQEKQ